MFDWKSWWYASQNIFFKAQILPDSFELSKYNEI